MVGEFDPEVIVIITPNWRQPAATRVERDARKTLETQLLEMAEKVRGQIRDGILAEQRAEAVRLSLQ